MVKIAEKNSFLTNALQFLRRPGNFCKIMYFANHLLPRLDVGCQIHSGMGAIAYRTIADAVSVCEELDTISLALTPSVHNPTPALPLFPPFDGL